MKYQRNLCLCLFLFLFGFTEGYTQKQFVFECPSLLPDNDTVLCYLPSTYQPESIYPAVYMLHGAGGNYKYMGSILDLQALADKYGFIIICPDGFKYSYYLDSPLQPNMQYETFFITVLMKAIADSISVDTVNTFITGLSMGGGGAMSFFLKYPEKFRSAASSSGLFDLSCSSNRDTWLKDLLGDYNTNNQKYESNSAVTFLPNLQNKVKVFYFDCGTEDFLIEPNKYFYRKAMDLGLRPTFITKPGKHDAAYWKTSFPAHFEFFSLILQSNH